MRSLILGRIRDLAAWEKFMSSRFPASDVESSGIAEAAYRVFEIALASIGLIVARL